MLEQAIRFDTTPKTQDQSFQSWQSSLGKTARRLDPEARTAAPVPSFGRMVHDNVSVVQSYATGNAAAPETTGKPDIAYTGQNKDDEYSFGDIIDMINPLQHLPVIGTLYRKLTGDAIKPMSDIIGGAIFGGPVGAVASTMNVVVKSTTGKDIAENAFAVAGFDVTPAPAKPLIAYEKAASLASSNDRTHASVIRLDMDSKDTFVRKNFAGEAISRDIWNA